MGQCEECKIYIVNVKREWSRGNGVREGKCILHLNKWKKILKWEKEQGKRVNNNKKETKLEKKIHHSTINNKCAKINIGEMGMEEKKKESKA